jgi:hypothetical protein
VPSLGRSSLTWTGSTIRRCMQNLLKHPLYAGAYVYGRQQRDRRRSQPERPQSGRVVRARSDWHSFLPDRCPAYLSWEQYERNVARLEANRYRATTLGAVRKGAALLAGLVVCGRCGNRLGVHYQHSHGHPDPFTYDCTARKKQLWRTSVPACGWPLLRRVCHCPGALGARACLAGAVALGGRAGRRGTRNAHPAMGTAPRTGRL